MRSCGECQWWVESKDRDLKGLGRCKVGPPTTGKGGLGDWPVTGVAEWCGAFRVSEVIAASRRVDADESERWKRQREPSRQITAATDDEATRQSVNHASKPDRIDP